MSTQADATMAIGSVATLPCRFCGDPLPQARRHGSERLYCSPQHRMAAWDRDNPRIIGQRRLEFAPEASRQSLKREGRRERILARLRLGPARTWEILSLGGSGMSSRLRELRESGFQIECEQDEEGATYRLVGEPPA